MAVVIQNSNESRLIYGADVSGRVFKEISDRIYYHYISKNSIDKPLTPDTLQYRYLGMKSELATVFQLLNMPYTDSAVNGLWRTMNLKNNTAGLAVPSSLSTAPSVVPDVKGMGLKDAVYLLENKGMKTIATGRGRVVSQSLAAGSIFKKGDKILLMLN
jgi:cell division protein FtsI (penicillin-binding protein 3)